MNNLYNVAKHKPVKKTIVLQATKELSDTEAETLRKQLDTAFADTDYRPIVLPHTVAVAHVQ